MKKLFLIFGALFAFAGCADESGSNNIVSNACPISSADFNYERIAQNQYQITLNDENKRQYAGSVIWKANNNSNLGGATETNEIEPLIIWENGGDLKEATFYYNNIQCGSTLTLKPQSTYGMCDNITINYDQGDIYISGTTNPQLKVSYPFNFDYTNTQSKIVFDSGIEYSGNLVASSGYVNGYFTTQYNVIEGALQNYTDLYLDLVITYPDNTECIKELKYYIR